MGCIAHLSQPQSLTFDSQLWDSTFWLVNSSQVWLAMPLWAQPPVSENNSNSRHGGRIGKSLWGHVATSVIKVAF